MRWELNDLARRLDARPVPAELPDSFPHAENDIDPSPVGPNLQRILAAIDSLPDDEREVFNLVKVQRMSGAEAAAVIGRAIKTVRRRLGRGLLRWPTACGISGRRAARGSDSH